MTRMLQFSPTTPTALDCDSKSFTRSPASSSPLPRTLPDKLQLLMLLDQEAAARFEVLLDKVLDYAEREAIAEGYYEDDDRLSYFYSPKR